MREKLRLFEIQFCHILSRSKGTLVCMCKTMVIKGVKKTRDSLKSHIKTVILKNSQSFENVDDF